MRQKTKREKGLEFQRWIKKWLTDKEWDCVNIPSKGIFITDKKTKKKRYISLSQDIFACDLIARKTFSKQTWDYTMELWIQATLGPNVARKIEEVAKHPFMTNEMIETHIWIKAKSGLINIKRLHKIGAGEIESEDLGKIIRGKFYASEGVGYEF